MGNRAVITTSDNIKPETSAKLGVYLHWNGGRDSVEGFLTYCTIRGFRTPDEDSYGWARLVQIIANFIGGDISIGLDQTKGLDCNNYDNGVYLIKGWEIVGRKFHDGEEQLQYPLREVLLEIDKAQPEPDRLGVEKIDAYLNR